MPGGSEVSSINPLGPGTFLILHFSFRIKKSPTAPLGVLSVLAVQKCFHDTPAQEENFVYRGAQLLY